VDPAGTRVTDGPAAAGGRPWLVAAAALALLLLGAVLWLAPEAAEATEVRFAPATDLATSTTTWGVEGRLLLAKGRVRLGRATLALLHCEVPFAVTLPTGGAPTPERYLPLAVAQVQGKPRAWKVHAPGFALAGIACLALALAATGLARRALRRPSGPAAGLPSEGG
jgi:hypothetical protein